MNVIQWAEHNWIIPETGRPIVLRPWQKSALLAMFPPDGSRPPWETFLISAPKKCGKTELDAIATTYAALTFPAPEVAYVVANDELQATERVFDRIARALRAMGLERRGAVSITRTEIVFRETGTRVIAIPADWAGAAGAVFGISSWTELWAFRFEGHVRLWEELTPIPGRRSLRIVDSYAGFASDLREREALGVHRERRRGAASRLARHGGRGRRLLRRAAQDPASGDVRATAPERVAVR
jgi:hypothetical protein